VAAPDAVFVVECVDAIFNIAVARVEQAEHGTVDCGRAKVGFIAAGDSTHAVTSAAGDAVAFDEGLLAEFAVRRHDCQLFRVLVLWVQGRADFFPLVEERAEIDDQVLGHRQRSERFDRDRFRVQRFDSGLAGKAGHPIDAHCARAAHTNPARTAKRQRRVEFALDDEQRVEHRHPAIEFEREMLFRVRMRPGEFKAVGGHSHSDAKRKGLEAKTLQVL